MVQVEPEALLLFIWIEKEHVFINIRAILLTKSIKNNSEHAQISNFIKPKHSQGCITGVTKYAFEFADELGGGKPRNFFEGKKFLKLNYFICK